MLWPIEKELVLSQPGLHLTCEYTRESQGLLGCPREIGICLKIGIKMTTSKWNFYKLYLISLTLPLHVSDFLSFSSILWTVITRPSENSDFRSRFDINISGIDSCFSSCQSDHNKSAFSWFFMKRDRELPGVFQASSSNMCIVLRFLHSNSHAKSRFDFRKGSEAYWFYALGACLLLHLVHRLGYKNSSTMSFLPDLWTKSACERRLTVTKPCDRSWNQRALKLVLAISLEEEMLRGEEQEAAEGAGLKLRLEMTRVVAVLDCSSMFSRKFHQYP
ncbi:hypothetical protein VNO77_19002 [Canavalia gladiata]|uniref:Uncharacterized protein n=1 Tax=Canavalia gladiata TaxID=3824 RepID=A0AAN9LLP1_CANGL